MKHSTRKPTKAQARRFEKLKELGCIACSKHGQIWAYRCTEIHHLNIGGRAGQKRRGHDFTIPLCDWHHRGVRKDSGLSILGMQLWYGPSLAKQSKLFRETYGTDDELLAEVNKLIGVSP